MSTSHNVPLTWRARGFPPTFQPDLIATILSIKLQDKVEEHNIITCAQSFDSTDLDVTIRFDPLPATLEGKTKHTIVPDATDEWSDGAMSLRIELDLDFIGLTVLASPSPQDFKVNILALSGLGSHPLGSFTKKRDVYMWVRDDLIKIKEARIVLYGYNTKMKDSNSHALVGDLATTLQSALDADLSRENHKPYIVIAHSLGGLVVHEMMLQIADNAERAHWLNDFHAFYFFGVPSLGMEIQSFLPVVSSQPNALLIMQLGSDNTVQNHTRQFKNILADYKVNCYYETEQSPTVTRDAAGNVVVNGPKELLVHTNSAKACLRDCDQGGAIALQLEHSDLVKFSSGSQAKNTIVRSIGRACTWSHWLPRIEAAGKLIDKDAELAERMYMEILRSLPDDTDSYYIRACVFRGLLLVNKVLATKGDATQWKRWLVLAERCQRVATGLVKRFTLMHELLQLDALDIKEVGIALDVLHHLGEADVSKQSIMSRVTELKGEIKRFEQEVKRNYNTLCDRHRITARMDLLIEYLDADLAAL